MLQSVAITPGTGKTHLLIALGTAAAEHGYRVKYTLASKLVNELAEAAGDRELSRTVARYGRVDLLLIDELGYLQPGPPRRRAALRGPHRAGGEDPAWRWPPTRAFSAWTKTFTDPRLCAAIVDRLTYNGHIIETGTNSYRLAHARAAEPSPANGQDHQEAS